MSHPVCTLLYFLLKIYHFKIFVWLHLVFITARRIFSCGVWTLSCSMQDLVPWPRIEPRPPALGAQSPSHWTTREFLHCSSNKHFTLLFSFCLRVRTLFCQVRQGLGFEPELLASALAIRLLVGELRPPFQLVRLKSVPPAHCWSPPDSPLVRLKSVPPALMAVTAFCSYLCDFNVLFVPIYPNPIVNTLLK